MPQIFATCSWPSLCKQSELQCYRPRHCYVFVAAKHAKKINKVMPQTSPHVRGPHFASKVSYHAIAPDFATCSWPSLCKQSELQCYRPRHCYVFVAAKHAKKINKVMPQTSPHVRGPHFASKVSYSAIAPDFRHASVSLINSCFNSIKHPIRYHGNSKMLHPSSEGLYLLAAASNATCGRRQCCSRPKVALLAAASI